jgi:hypothetical protein
MREIRTRLAVKTMAATKGRHNRGAARKDKLLNAPIVLQYLVLQHLVLQNIVLQHFVLQNNVRQLRPIGGRNSTASLLRPIVLRNSECFRVMRHP